MSKTLTLAGAVLSALHNGHDPNADRQSALSALALRDSSFAPNISTTLNGTTHNMYAGHSSHASHASHASGSSGYYQAPPPPPSYPASQAPSSVEPLQPLAPTRPVQPKPTGDQLQRFIMRVQAALFSKGYDPGAIDGVLTEETKSALRKFQSAHGMAPTGKMTTETLNALGVAISP